MDKIAEQLGGISGGIAGRIGALAGAHPLDGLAAIGREAGDAVRQAFRIRAVFRQTVGDEHLRVVQLLSRELAEQYDRLVQCDGLHDAVRAGAHDEQVGIEHDVLNVVDEAHRVQPAVVAPALNAVNRHTGSKLVNAVQQDVHAILQLGEAQIEKSARALIDAARNEADEKLSAELSRLEALRAVNPNIRDDELTAIESNRQQVMESLDQAGWRLDALRLIVVTHQ